MRQCWLRTNMRAMLLGMIAPALMLASGLGLVLAVPGEGIAVRILRLFGWGLIAVAGLAWGTILFWMRLPRLAYQDGKLLVYLRGIDPIHVPIEIVECFFLGQTPSMLHRHDNDATTSAVIVRLAESARSWRQADVKQALGTWCDGHITIRGTWCEPLTRELIGQLNAKLIQAHRQHRQGQETESA